jgi:hypothetical protein
MPVPSRSCKIAHGVVGAAKNEGEHGRFYLASLLVRGFAPFNDIPVGQPAYMVQSDGDTTKTDRQCCNDGGIM